VRRRSLRSRLITAVVIWAVCVCAAIAVAMAVVAHHPDWVWRVHFALPILVGLGFMGAGIMAVRRGLTPFATLRERLGAVRDGRTATLEGEYPSEVAPLVDDLNMLLNERERRVARAVAKAGDLAHGLKTPLAILAQEIERAGAAGQHDLAASIREQVERMRRQIDSHLAQARVTAAGVAPTARASVADSARGLERTMQRLYAERALVVAVDVPAELVVRVPAEDLEEMLGNLLDNACKWAKSRVAVSATLDGARVVVNVDDDGAGLPASMREQVLRRGVRADETAPGSGLGLAIARDLAEAYGGSVALERSPQGGVRARLVLPA
jgi:signal transduction histidine kinase